MSDAYLLQGGCVLTLGSRTPNLSTGDVLIENGVIAEVGQGLRARNAETIDASDTIVMPGFIDCHRHTWKSLFRNSDVWADDDGNPSLSAEDVYAAALVGLSAALQTGITTVADWIDLSGPSELTEAVLQAHRDSRARTVAVVSDVDHAVDSWSEDSSRIHSSAYGDGILDREPQQDGWAKARAAGLRIHAHIGGDQGGLVAALAAAGRLGEDVTLIHCPSLDESDLRAIGSSGASVVSAPSSEMSGGLGIPPVQRLIDNGIRPGLGVGYETGAPGDMFAQMRAINSVQHAETFDLKLSGKAGVPTLLTTRDVIKYATADGATSIGMGDEIGSLETGKRADVLVLRTDRPNVHPVNDPIGAVVWGMDSSNVDWVFVDGDPVLRNGELEGGSERARSLAIASHERLFGMNSGGHS